MVVLGLLLILAAVVLGTDIVLENTHHTGGTIFNQTVSSLSLGGIFLAGAITALVLALGLWLVLGGASRNRRKAAARKSTLRETQTQKETLAEENARLARQLEQERAATASVSPYDEEPGGGSPRPR
jgi:hypothetical protein